MEPENPALERESSADFTQTLRYALEVGTTLLPAAVVSDINALMERVTHTTKDSDGHRFFSLLQDCNLQEAAKVLEAEGSGLNPQEKALRQLLLFSHSGDYQKAYSIGLESLDLENPYCRFHFGRVAIAVGQWQQGLRLLDSVREHGFFGGQILTDKKPLWSREPLLGKTIVVSSEGGLGDAVCFSRFSPLFQRLGASVILATYPELFPLFRSLPGRPMLVDIKGVDHMDFDFWIPALSVPRLLQLELRDIPSAPFLQLPPSLAPVAIGSSERMSVGLCWSGNPNFAEDYIRSVQGSFFEPLVEKFPNLQFSSPSSISGDFSFEHRDIRNLSSEITSAEALAQYLKGLDLFISVDTGPAHLAAAMGVPTLLLNRTMGWITFSTLPQVGVPQKSPWYDSMEILHQKKWGHWDDLQSPLEKYVEDWVTKREATPRARSVKDIYHPDNPVPESGNEDLVETREGTFLTLPNDFYVGKALRFYGEYSQKEVEIYEDLIKPGDVVLEGGAHLGALTRVFSRLVGPEGHVYAFEPQETLFKVNTCNVALAPYQNVSLHHKGLSSDEGHISVPQLNFERVGNFGGLSLGPEDCDQGQQVPLIRLDSLNLERLDFLKLDIEGMELDALLGAKETVLKLKPLIFCEVDRAEKKPQILKLLSDWGYSFTEKNTFLFNADNFFSERQNIYQNKMSFNLLARFKH